MANLFDLTVASRNTFGKAANRRTRRLEDTVPAIIYGGKEEPVAISLSHNLVIRALENEAFFSHILTLNIDGKKKQQVIVKDIQRHPGRPRITHMDFLRVSADVKLTMSVPLHFMNEEKAPGVLAGGVVNHHMGELEIRCLPADLPEFIEIDLANLELDGVIHLTHIKVPKGVEVMLLAHGSDQAHDHAVVSIHIPKVVEEPEEGAPAEGAEGAEAAGEEGAESKAAGEGGEEAESSEK
ncbi:MAG: 50S ribosomal protein L25/general stress protein Ctc [Gammaproteobacteria bacterium]|nr:50S ribosomal protein L25/general stress protein Ctc [Gammaproteobacteria bacterium]